MIITRKCDKKELHMNNTLKFSFNVDSDLMVGIERLKNVLGYEIGEGISVTAVKGERLGVSFKNGEAVIYYPKKHLFFRELGVLVEHARISDECEITEDGFFDVVSTMIDVSRNGVLKVKAVNKMIDYLAVMGYGMAMLYTEDIIKLENYKYFGYMRGRYSVDELKAVDDYAYEYGIEVIPCLELYGHMGKYLFWPEAAPIKDTGEVLLAREEKTFKFVEELVATASSCFRSKRIHIGMDEAWDMGRGNFLTKHGYVPPFEIFTEYMERLIQITNKYGLTPMMWSDMYFRISAGNNDYYGKNTVIPKEIADKIPQEVELVFWHYGERKYCDDYMLKKHNELGRKVIYAGGLWGWIGHFPEHNYSIDSINYSLDACRNNNVREAMITIWTNDNNECELFTNLFGLSFFAEKCFDGNISEEKFKARFEAVTGGIYEAFYLMSAYHNKFDGTKEYKSYSDRFIGKPIFWQDIMDGLYDANLFESPMSSHYASCASEMKNYKGGRWDYLYDFAYKVFDYLTLKSLIAENLVPSYKKRNEEALEEISGHLLPLLKEKTIAVHEAHKAMWLQSYKAIGWANMDVRYAGVAARCDTAKMLIDRYINHEDEIIEELEEERLPKNLSGFLGYSGISSPNIKI